jgi:hypothetical protein
MPRTARPADVRTHTWLVHVPDIEAIPTPWQVAVVVRHTPYPDVGPSECFDLMRAYSDVGAADDEARRLNAAVRPGSDTTYFVKMLHQRSRT